MSGRLHRSRRDRMLAGVAGGLAEGWDVDPSLVRIVWALLVIFTSGVALVLYLVMAVVVPEEGDGRPGEASPVTADPLPPGAVGGGWTERQPGAVPGSGARPRRDSGSGALIGGALLIVIGAVLLVREYLPAIEFDWVWPLALIGLGAFLLVTATRRDRSDGTPR